MPGAAGRGKFASILQAPFDGASYEFDFDSLLYVFNVSFVVGDGEKRLPVPVAFIPKPVECGRRKFADLHPASRRAGKAISGTNFVVAHDPRLLMFLRVMAKVIPCAGANLQHAQPPFQSSGRVS